MLSTSQPFPSVRSRVWSEIDSAISILADVSLCSCDFVVPSSSPGSECPSTLTLGSVSSMISFVSGLLESGFVVPWLTALQSVFLSVAAAANKSDPVSVVDETECGTHGSPAYSVFLSCTASSTESDPVSVLDEAVSGTLN